MRTAGESPTSLDTVCKPSHRPLPILSCLYAEVDATGGAALAVIVMAAAAARTWGDSAAKATGARLSSLW
jgi:hypothetical protein